MVTRAELKQQAKNALKGNWGKAIVIILLLGVMIYAVTFIFSFGAIMQGIMVALTSQNSAAAAMAAVSGMFSAVAIPAIIEILVMGSFILGIAIFFLKLLRQSKYAGTDGLGNPEIGDLFAGFKSFGKALALYLLMGIFVFLWSLLFVIPGIIAAYRYSMAFYILADDPNCGPLEALKRSKAMMKGYKGNLFVLHLSFIGWMLLAGLTFGIGYLWLGPYMATTEVAFYDNLKNIPVHGQSEEALV